jgi:hypothetical protein
MRWRFEKIRSDKNCESFHFSENLAGVRFSVTKYVIISSIAPFLTASCDGHEKRVSDYLESKLSTVFGGKQRSQIVRVTLEIRRDNNGPKVLGSITETLQHIYRSFMTSR